MLYSMDQKNVCGLVSKLPAFFSKDYTKSKVNVLSDNMFVNSVSYSESTIITDFIF